MLTRISMAFWVRRDAQQRRGSFESARLLYFLEFEGPVDDLLWFGDLIAERKFHWEEARGSRRQLEYDLARPGLIKPIGEHATFLMRAAQHGAVVFEPESLYRAILYAAALAAVALTGACRVSELLQVSAGRFISLRVPEYFEGKPTGGSSQIWVQDLLPKGCKHETQRQFFLIAPTAAPLLREIAELLAATHGGTIPVVDPTRSTKAEHLRSERYLFQWGASSDGRLGLLDARDVNILLRLLFYGLEVTTSHGEPVKIAVHLLRHVTATHARPVAPLVRSSASAAAACQRSRREPGQHLLAIELDDVRTG